MKKLDEVIKFEILTDIKAKDKFYSKLTMIEICNHVQKRFDIPMTTNCLYRWAKIYNFSFKAQKAKPAPTIEEQIKHTNQRIRMLGIVMRNICRELDLRSPSMLDKLLDGIEDQFGIDCCLNTQTQDLENQIYESI